MITKIGELEKEEPCTDPEHVDWITKLSIPKELGPGKYMYECSGCHIKMFFFVGDTPKITS